jgi:hypothetical protein
MSETLGRHIKVLQRRKKKKKQTSRGDFLAVHFLFDSFYVVDVQ